LVSLVSHKFGIEGKVPSKIRKFCTPRARDKIQLMVYIWALPKSNNHRFRGDSFDGLLVYENHEIDIISPDLPKLQRTVFARFPDRNYWKKRRAYF
jgi:hypothetical protein